jgi:chemotaxis protein methyltransferase CheR
MHQQPIANPSLMLQNARIPDKNRLSDEEFGRISAYVTRNYGIKLPPEKKIMVEGRLQKRLRATSMPDFKSYVDYVLSEKGEVELFAMIDAISTNKTDFFRESSHFDYLRDVFLPQWVASHPHRVLNIWSAASSSGEECYTIAMVIEEFNRINNVRVEYNILGTDISREILRKAVTAVYATERIKDVPLELRNRYFLRSKNRDNDTVRVIPRLRARCKYGRLNLMDPDYKLNDTFDLIFCRNVLIYFDQYNQEQVINKLCSRLKPDGYFFLGHSESILGKNVPLLQLKPTIYKRKP